MPAGQQFSSIAAQTALSGAINNVQNNIGVNSTTGFPVLTAGQAFTGVIDIGLATQELVDVTNVTGLTLTATRGIDSSTAQAHANAATFTHAYIGRDAREARTHMDASSGVHGVAGSVVGTTDAQTLTNKALGAGSTFTANLVSVGAGTQLDLSANTGAKPVKGPQLLSYVPGTTGITVGNGTLSGGYVQYGRETFVEIYLVFGTTTTLGGSNTINLPINPSNYALLEGFYAVAGAGFWKVFAMNNVAGNGQMEVEIPSLGSNGINVPVTSTYPAAQAATSVLYLKGVVQTTS